MAERNSGEMSPTAVYEQGPVAYNIRRAGERLRDIFGDELEPKSWQMANNDPLRMRRYQADRDDVFVVSLRTTEVQNALTSVENASRDKPRTETIYVLQTGTQGSRMACFSDEMDAERQVEAAIWELFDRKDELSEQAFNTQLAALADERQQVTWRKDHLMISELQAKPELTASANQVRDLNHLLHYATEQQ